MGDEPNRKLANAEGEANPPAAGGSSKPTSTPQQPMVIVHYRSRGLPAVLLAPALILLAAGAIVIYREQLPDWPGLWQLNAGQQPAHSSNAPKRVIQVEPSGTPAPGETIALAKAETLAQSASQRTEKADAAVASVEVLDPAGGPEPKATSAGETTAPPPKAEPRVIHVEPSGVVDTEAQPAQAETPAQPRDVASQPDTVNDPAANPPPERAQPRPLVPAIGFDPLGVQKPPDSATPAAPAGNDDDVTPREVQDAIARDAAEKKAKLEELERMKPIWEKEDERQRGLHTFEQIVEATKKANEDRVKFLAELKKLLARPSQQTAQSIRDLCDWFGRDTIDAVLVAAEQFRLGTRERTVRMSLKGRVQRLRELGVPETRILDYLEGQEMSNIRARGGPRNADEALVRAAKHLIEVPIVVAKPGAPAAKQGAPATKQASPAPKQAAPKARPASGAPATNRPPRLAGAAAAPPPRAPGAR